MRKRILEYITSLPATALTIAFVIAYTAIDLQVAAILYVLAKYGIALALHVSLHVRPE